MTVAAPHTGKQTSPGVFRSGGDGERAALWLAAHDQQHVRLRWETKMVDGCEKAFSILLYWVTGWLRLLADRQIGARIATTPGNIGVVEELIFGWPVGERRGTWKIRSFGLPPRLAVAVRIQPSVTMLRQQLPTNRSLQPPQF